MCEVLMAELTGAEAVKDSTIVNNEQYVTFIIGEENYGVNILKVQEIIGMTRITKVPNMLDYMKGVINLRGKVIPVIDMRLKFNMPEKEYDDITVILIVEVNDREVGMIVDSVSDVMEIIVSSVQDTPQFHASIDTNYIKGIGNVGEMLIILLDVNGIMSYEEFEKIEKNQKV